MFRAILCERTRSKLLLRQRILLKRSFSLLWEGGGWPCKSCWNNTRQHMSSSFKRFCYERSSNLKCSEQTLVPAAIVNSFPSSQWIALLHYLYPFSRRSETQQLVATAKQNRPKQQDFSGEALSKQNIKAYLASLSLDSSRAPTEWSAIFAFGV